MSRVALVRVGRVRAGLVRAGLVVGLVLLAIVGAASAASAHNLLLSTDPSDKSTVAQLPKQVTLTFNEPALALGSVLEVLGPAGNVAEGPPSLIDRQVRQAIRPGSPAGAYRVVWRVTSLDGHPISGEFDFTATAGDGGTAPSEPAQTAATAALPPVSNSTGSSGGGGATSIVLLLIAAGALVVIGGFYLAVRNPGPSRGDDEPAAGDQRSSGGDPLGGTGPAPDSDAGGAAGAQ
jgi:methionine-rich copper-binding protein CopC